MTGKASMTAPFQENHFLQHCQLGPFLPLRPHISVINVSTRFTVIFSTSTSRCDATSKLKTTGYVTYYTSLVETGGRLRGQTVCGVLQSNPCALFGIYFPHLCNYFAHLCNYFAHFYYSNLDKMYGEKERKKYGWAREKFLERVGDSQPVYA